jgi:hypothetical protein
MDPEADIPGQSMVDSSDDVTVTKTVTQTEPPKTIIHSFVTTATVISIVGVQETQNPRVATVTVAYKDDSSPKSSSPPPAETSSQEVAAAAGLETSDPTAPAPQPEHPSSAATTLSTVTMPLLTAAGSSAPTATGGSKFDAGMWHGQGIWNSTTMASRFRRHK